LRCSKILELFFQKILGPGVFLEVVFEIKEVFQHWAPPFEKRTEEKSFTVKENENFDQMQQAEGQPIFRLVSAHQDKALVEYNRLYTLKGYSQPANRQVWINLGDSIEFSYLWGNHGITKKLTYKGLNGGQ
jgi:triphosphoribosyl-dephospho-CoA synthetase